MEGSLKALGGYHEGEPPLNFCSKELKTAVRVIKIKGRGRG